MERREGSRGLPGAWASWATAVLVSVVVWAAVSASAQDWTYVWPIWFAGPWGAVLVARTFFGRGGGPDGGGRRPGRRDG